MNNKKITDYNKFWNLKEYDKLSDLTYFRLWMDEYFNKKYILQTRVWEMIISYKEWLFFIDWFMIWNIVEMDWKMVFNLIYIHSFKKWIWTKMLLTYINKHKIKNIYYLPNSWFDFWKKIKVIFKDNNITLKTIWDNIEFQ
jgi:hypothetical protein